MLPSNQCASHPFSPLDSPVVPRSTPPLYCALCIVVVHLSQKKAVFLHVCEQLFLTAVSFHPPLPSPPVLKTRGGPNTPARVSTLSGTRPSSTKTSCWSRYVAMSALFKNHVRIFKMFERSLRALFHFKGIVHTKLKRHPFSAHHCVDGGSSVLSNPQNPSGVPQRERPPPNANTMEVRGRKTKYVSVLLAW